jgi:hypothetical protein
MKLEKLPFLSACVREGIRLLMELSLACHDGHTNLYSTKIAPYLPRRQCQRLFFDVNHDEEAFPYSYKFVLER